jgi:histidinol-phosphatase (PHP family)
MLFNTHTHTEYSADASGSFTEIFDRALECGMSYIAITDHLELTKSNYSKLHDLYNYHQELTKYKRQYAAKGLYIAIGIEVGWLKQSQHQVKALFDKYPMEYIINSVHDFDNYTEHSKAEFYNNYLQAVYDSLDAVYQYDAIGHFGFYTRYDKFEDNSMTLREFGDKIERVIDRVVHKGIILEVNARGNPDVQSTVPSLEILKLYKQKGGQLITYASDSHNPSMLMFNHKETCNVAKQAGFEYWTIKVDGKMRQVKIDR